MSVLNESNVQQLLDFSRKLDIGFLDQVVQRMYEGSGDEQKLAQSVLTSLKEHPDSWVRVDAILEYSENEKTKYFALQILENVIKSRWKILPRGQCEGIKKYIVGIIIKTSSDATAMENQSVLLGKLNMVLVQILKHEWPKNWPTFISEIVGSSKTNECLCQNNLTILKLLSEEVFDFSLGQLTQTKAKHLKDCMCAEFSSIFELCQFVLTSSRNAPLVASTLETFLRFIHWIPFGYIFETQIIEQLVNNFLNVPIFRNVTLKCLTEIAAINEPRYEQKFIELFQSSVQRLREILPLDCDLQSAYQQGSDNEQKFIQNLALFYSTILKEHDQSFQRLPELSDARLDAHQYLLCISMVDDIEIFKICLEYWNSLCVKLYREQNESFFGGDNSGSVKMLPSYLRSILTELRRIMISRMARPEEVLVVENEQGEVVREFMKDTDSINLYKNMRETLVYLTHLDYKETEAIMTEKLHRQMDDSVWSWKDLNTLCWAIGSISGSLSEDDERRFLVIAIRDLLSLCEQKKGKDNKAIVASNIMYVVGQYPRFLRAHWRFLKTVITKLFEFMHETHDGVQDMACDTFIKIANKCRRQFVIQQPGEKGTFVEEIISNLSNIICDLQSQQVHTFYEAVGIMLHAVPSNDLKEELVQRLYMPPNLVWDQIINEASANIDVLRDHTAVRHIINIIKTNISGCKTLCNAYLIQLYRIYMDLLNIYKVMSSNINQAIQNNGPEAMNQPIIRSMRTVKKEALKLIYTFIQSANGRSQDLHLIADNFTGPLLEAVLLDYQHNIPPAREPEVLLCVSIFINELKHLAEPHVPAILDALFQCTLEMINQDMEEYPEHRTHFFALLDAVTTHSFLSFMQLNPVKFKIVLDSVIWAMKHTMRNVSELGLQILHTMIRNVASIDKDRQQVFYQALFMDILTHLFAIITDASQTGNLSNQAALVGYLFEILEDGTVSAPLSTEMTSDMNNVTYVRNYLARLLKDVFPHLQEAQIRVFIDGVFSYNRDVNNLREHLRDFLIQIREISGEDLSDLYLEEREAEIQKAQQEKLKTKKSVPGLIGPHDMIEEMAC